MKDAQNMCVLYHPSPCISYANVRNSYGPYAHCSLDKGVACAKHIQLKLKFVILWALLLSEKGYFGAFFTFSQTPGENPLVGFGVRTCGIPSMRCIYKATVAVDMLAILYGFAPWRPGHRLMFSFGMGLDLQVPKVISLIWSC